MARDAADKESYVSRKFNRPRLMKTILKLGYGAMDNDLPISDKPFLIKEDNLEKAEKIISGKTKYLLPVVYVTKKFGIIIQFWIQMSWQKIWLELHM